MLAYKTFLLEHFHIMTIQQYIYIVVVLKFFVAKAFV